MCNIFHILYTMPNIVIHCYMLLICILCPILAVIYKTHARSNKSAILNFFTIGLHIDKKLKNVCT